MLDFKYCKLQVLRDSDQALKGGDWNQSLLLRDQALERKKIAREERLYLANLCRRTGNAEKSLKLLLSVVSPKRLKDIKPTVEEVAEYSGALIQMGALGEAQSRLNSVKPDDPDILLQQAFCKIRQWDYKAALTPLKAFTEKTQGYYQMVGLVNYAASLVHLKQTQEAQSLLTRLREQSKTAQAFRLYRNTLELSAQNALNQKAYQKAEDFLENISNQVAPSSFETLYVNKWKLILDLEKTKPSADKIKFRSRFKQLHQQASLLRDPETLRDLDRIAALYKKDLPLFLKVYCGTPFPAYKTYLKEAYVQYFGHEFSEPETYVWFISKSSRNETVQNINLCNGLVGNSVRLKDKQIFLRSLLALSKDFYKGLEIAAFHDQVFEGEYYNPYTSPNRVHQSIRRIKNFLAKNINSLNIIHRQNQYLLSSQSATTITIPMRSSQVLSQDLEKLISNFKDEDFKVQEVKTLIDKSLRMANRVLEEGLKVGRLRAIGNGRRRRYIVI
jgi:hypothetical protein